MATKTYDKIWYSESRVRQVISQDLDTWRSRYDLKEQLLLNDYKIVIRNMKSGDMIPSDLSNATPHKIQPEEQFRPDIVANTYYEDPRLAWVILAANGMSDIFQFNSNQIILIPSYTSLFMTGGVLAR